jgi:hypothetical protein
LHRFSKKGIDMAASRAPGLMAVTGALFTAQLVAAGAAMAAPPGSTGPVRVPLAGVFRLCDHEARTFVPTVGDAQGLAVISTTGNTVTALVTLNYAPADRHYAVTVEDGILPGATGAWVLIDRPREYSQKPAEHYTSDFIAAI